MKRDSSAHHIPTFWKAYDPVAQLLDFRRGHKTMLSCRKKKSHTNRENPSATWPVAFKSCNSIVHDMVA